MKRFQAGAEAGEAGGLECQVPSPLDETSKLGGNVAVAELGIYVTPSSLLSLTGRCVLPVTTRGEADMSSRGPRRVPRFTARSQPERGRHSKTRRCCSWILHHPARRCLWGRLDTGLGRFHDIQYWLHDEDDHEDVLLAGHTWGVFNAIEPLLPTGAGDNAQTNRAEKAHMPSHSVRWDTLSWYPWSLNFPALPSRRKGFSVVFRRICGMGRHALSSAGQLVRLSSSSFFLSLSHLGNRIWSRLWDNSPHCWPATREPAFLPFCAPAFPILMSPLLYGNTSNSPLT